MSFPFVNARPVWNPAANGLRATSSRIRNHTIMSMRGFARAEVRYAFDDLPHFDKSAIALVALRNAVLVAFAIVLWRAIAPGSGRPTRTA